MLPPPAGIAAEIVRPAVLTVFAVACWATGVLPEHVTALAFFGLAMLFSIAPPEVVFAGFLSASLWLVLSGLILGVAIMGTGLGAWVAQSVLGGFGTSYVRLVSGLVVVGMTLTFVMPSTIGRTLLLIPLVVALAERLGFAAGTPGRTGLVMAAAMGTYMPAAAILPANIPNLALAGAAETLYGLTFHYGSYLLWHLPVTGVLKAIAIVLLICRMYPATMQLPGRVHAPPPLTRDQHVLVAVLLLALGLWVSDAFHHLSPAWVGLGVALFCVLPGVDLVPRDAFNGRIPLSPLLYLAGILGVSALVAQSGVGSALGHTLLDRLPIAPEQDIANFAALVGVSTLLSLITTTVGVPAVLTPFAAELATAAHWPLLTVLMTQVIGYSTVLFPYQAPPLVLAMQLGGVPPATGIRVTLTLAAITLLVLTPLNYVWWRLLGYVG